MRQTLRHTTLRPHPPPAEAPVSLPAPGAPHGRTQVAAKLGRMDLGGLVDGRLGGAISPASLQQIFGGHGGETLLLPATRRMGLPRHVDSVSVWGTEGDGPMFAVVTPSADGDSFDADVVDSAGRCRARVSGYRTVTFRENVAAEAFEALRDRPAMMAMADD